MGRVGCDPDLDQHEKLSPTPLSACSNAGPSATATTTTQSVWKHTNSWSSPTGTDIFAPGSTVSSTTAGKSTVHTSAATAVYPSTAETSTDNISAGSTICSSTASTSTSNPTTVSTNLCPTTSGSETTTSSTQTTSS